MRTTKTTGSARRRPSPSRLIFPNMPRERTFDPAITLSPPFHFRHDTPSPPFHLFSIYAGVAAAQQLHRVTTSKNGVWRSRLKNSQHLSFIVFLGSVFAFLS